MAQVVLVLGASGLFGSAAASAFAAAGWQVRRYRRGTDMTAAAQGADVIVNGLNPPNYHNWAKLIPQITAHAIAAAKASGATLIAPTNVYNFGIQPGPWGPDTPQRPVSRKGAIRVQMEADYRAATAQGVQVILLRGGDFVAPDQPGSIFHRVNLKGVAKGHLTSFGAPNVTRAYAYLPDMARVAVALADKRADLPGFTDIPFAGHDLSMTRIATELEQITGRQMKIGRFPWLLMRLAAPVWEMARELLEMRYLYETDHALDPAPLAHLLPDFRMTPVDVILADHLPKAQGAISTQTGR